MELRFHQITKKTEFILRVAREIAEKKLSSELNGLPRWR